MCDVLLDATYAIGCLSVISYSALLYHQLMTTQNFPLTKKNLVLTFIYQCRIYPEIRGLGVWQERLKHFLNIFYLNYWQPIK